MKVGIIGAAGYTGGELMRLLVHHPKVELVSAVSQSQQGLDVTQIHKDLIGDLDLEFSDSITDDVELIFLCRGHGASTKYFEQQSDHLGLRIIDLSTDFRPRSNTQKFIYGLPEINKNPIAKSKRIANPGCFATAIKLALLPLANRAVLNDTIHVHAITGSTGAGQKPTPTTHFSWRNNNVSIYKLFRHQHLSEIKETLVHLQPDFNQDILFVPMRGDFPRGIFASVHTQLTMPIGDIMACYTEYYKDHAFVFVTQEEITLKEVVNTNKCFIQINKFQNTVHITSVIDNLLKGASGQAVQNMNIMMSWPENMGLNLKSITF